MRNWYWLAALCFVIACSEEKTDLSGNTPLKINDFNKVFKTVTLPINISDTNLAKVRDTIKIGAKALAQFVPDSVVEKIIPGKDQKAILYPLLKIEKETEYYLMLNVHHPKKEEIVVVVFSKKNAYLDYKIITQFLEKNKTVHLLVNNTGGPAAGPLFETSINDLKLAFESHVLHAHQMVQLILPGMRAANFGRIVNILSVSIKEPIDDLGISNTIRAGMANWAKTLSRELGQWGITVNNVLPGFTKTERLKYLFSTRAEKAGVSIEAISKNIENEMVTLT